MSFNRDHLIHAFTALSILLVVVFVDFTERPSNE